MEIGGVLLAAGRSSRTEGHHKLLAEFDGVPLIRKSAQTMLHSRLSNIVAVVGYRSSDVEHALRGLTLSISHCGDFSLGMGASLAHGFAHESLRCCAGVLVMLADMPEVTSDHIDRLVDFFVRSGGEQVVRGSHASHPGHPVIVPPFLYQRMRELRGDEGARSVLRNADITTQLVDLGRAALSDVDTPCAVASAGGILRS